MESDRNRPFYLKKNRNTGKSLIMAGIFLVVLALAIPFFLLVAPILIVYGLIVLKRGRSELNVFLDKAIEFYDKNQEAEALVMLEQVLQLEKDNTKATIIASLIKYNEKEYDETIRLLSSIDKKLVNEALDLQLKLADSYLKTRDYKNAETLYKEILKLQPKSDFIKKALQQCALEHEEA